MPGNMDYLPRHPSDFQSLSSLNFSIDFESKGSGFYPILHLTDLLKHLHAIDCSFVSLFQRIAFCLMDPQLGPGNFLLNLRKSADMIKMGMGHDHPFDILQFDPQLPDRINFIIPLSDETRIDEGKVLRRWVSNHTGVGIRHHHVLPRNEVDTLGNLGHRFSSNFMDF